MPDWRQKGKERVKEKSEGNTLKLREGDNCIRIMPDKKDLLPDGKLNPKGVQHSPVREFRIHQEVGPDKGMTGCGVSIDGEGKCWICHVKIPDLEKKGKHQLAAQLEAREKFVVQASRYDPDTQKFSAPKPWWVSSGAGIPGKSATGTLAVRVYSKLASSKKDYVDPVKGYNLNIERTGEGMKTRYPSVEGDETPTKVPLEILKLVQDLDKLIPQYDEDDQKSLYFGRPKEEDEDKPRSKKRGRQDDDDSDNDDDDSETEDSEVETEDEGETEEVEEDTEVENDEDVEEAEEDEEEKTEEVEEVEDEPEPEEEEEVEEEEEEAPPPPKKTATKKAVAKKGGPLKKGSKK